MAVNDILKVRYMCRRGGQLGQNIRHYRVSAETGPGATQQEIADALHPDVGPEYAAAMTNLAEFFRVGVQKVSPGLVPLENLSTGAPITGGFSGDPLPSQVSGVITLTTGFVGRANRGRAYVPFPAEDASGPDSRPTAGYAIALNALGIELVATKVIVGAAGSTTLVPVIFSRATAEFRTIVSFIARTIWGTQRRRGDYGAGNFAEVA